MLSLRAVPMQSLCLALLPLSLVCALPGHKQPYRRATFPSASRRTVVSRLPAPPKSPAAAYGNISLHFEANQGQTAPQVKFLARGEGYSLFLTPTEAVFTLRTSKSAERLPLQNQIKRRAQPPHTSEDLLRMRLVGANPLPGITGQQILPSKLNYFVGSDPAKWHSNVAAYGQVLYKRVYPGIDLLYYGNQRQLEYDFTLAAHADPGKIKLDFDGATRLHVDTAGNLMVGLHGGDVRWHKPVCYQQVNGKRQAVTGKYVLLGENRVSFALAKYDRTKPLVIDPVLAYSTYLGGTHSDTANDLAVDAAGNAYIVGTTNSTDFPAANAVYRRGNRGSNDVFIAKLSADGSRLLYFTYLGGSDNDSGKSIALDAAGNAYVTGQTYSTDFPFTSGAYQQSNNGSSDSFVAKLSADGSQLLYSTYLGGKASDYGAHIAVDSAGSAYVTGVTSSPDFPTLNPIQKTGGVFVTKLNADGSSLVYSTYLGGTGGDFAGGIAVDATGSAYVVGDTGSTDFPVTDHAYQKKSGGLYDVFVSKLNADGTSLDYSTYLGGQSNESGTGVAVDAAGNAYVTGNTYSTDFPVTDNALQKTSSVNGKAFVSKLSADGSQLVYSSYFGGSGYDIGLGIALDRTNNIYLTGETASSDFPTTADALYHSLSGMSNAFVSQLSADGSQILYSTYLGGKGTDTAWGVKVSPKGSIYIAGGTNSSDFPVTPTALQTGYQGSGDAFVSSIRLYTRYDFNGDGSADILLQDPANGYLAAWTMNGLTRQSALHIYNGFGPYRVVAVDDFNGDNQNDIILQNPSTGTVICWFMNGFQRLGNPVYVTTNLSADFTVVGAADFDGDGKPDLILQDQKNAQIVVWLLDGVKLKSRRTLLAAGAIDPNWHIVGNSDFNGNGVQALFFQNQATNRLSVWLYKNLVFLGSAYLDKIPPTGWHVVGVADLKGDGTPTLLLQDHSSGRLAAWFLSGTHVSGAVYLSGAVPPGYQATGLR